MSKGYPSKSRAGKAYWRGVAAAERGLRNPYQNVTLTDLWARGLQAGRANPSLVVPPEFRPRPVTPPKASRPVPRRPSSGDRPGPNDRRPGSGWGRR